MKHEAGSRAYHDEDALNIGDPIKRRALRSAYHLPAAWIEAPFKVYARNVEDVRQVEVILSGEPIDAGE